MAASPSGQSPLVLSLASLLRNCGDLVLDGSSTLTLTVASLQQLTRLFEQYLLSRSQQHGFLALPSHPAETASLLQLQFLFDVLQKTLSLKLINPPGARLQSVVKIFPFKSLKSLELKRIPPHCLEGLRGIYSQLEVFTCSKSLNSLEELLSLCGGDLSSALPWLELHTLNFSYNSIVCLDQSIGLLNSLKSLDLSHNKIQDCAEFLKPLSELEHLNLGYNCLQRAPTLGLSAKAKLVTLNLRNNELETINGVEQLSSLQHLDLAYNLLLEHSQLAPLSLLHRLATLNLEGNPLCFQRLHRTCTVRHLSPKAATGKLKLDGAALSSSELSVLPKPGQLIVQPQATVAPPPPSIPSERSNAEVSSGAGELSDSVSVGEVAVSSIRKKKLKSKVKVRRASISEPSDTDYGPRFIPAKQSLVLPHQQEIERMSSFREQLGEDWLRYQHHLDQGSPSVKPQAPPPPLSNGLSGATPPRQSPPPALEDPELLPSPEDLDHDLDQDQDQDQGADTESTLQWPGHDSRPAESTLGDGVGDSPLVATDGKSPGSGASPGGGSVHPKEEEEQEEQDEQEEEEEDLGVDLCHPLLVGVLSDKEEEDGGSLRGQWSSISSRRRREVFLRVRQGLVQEVDVQHGRERCRLELDSLVQVESTEAAWTRGETEEILPAVELHFDYINRDKKRRRYLLLDDDPQALQALTDLLAQAAKENRRRVWELRLVGVRLQCLRCRSEFTRQGKEEEEEQEEQQQGEEPEIVRRRRLVEGGEEGTQRHDGEKGHVDVCPECGSDHVVQLSGQSAPNCSTPISDDNDYPNTIPTIPSAFKDDDHTDGSRVGTPLIDTTAATDDATFVTAQGSSLFCRDGSQADASGFSSSSDHQSKDSLAGSYCYTSIATTAGTTGASPPDFQVPPPAGRSTPNGDLDLLSEDYEAVDHRLQLFLDVVVFEEEDEEELHSYLKMSAIKFGDPGEVPYLLVVSNQRVYFLEITSDPQDQLAEWLQKRHSHPIGELSYLEVGLGSQSIHMEFDGGSGGSGGEDGGGGDGDGGGPAYTLLVRDSARCKRFFALLTGVVRELAHRSDSKLKSISTSRLNPQHHLWPLVCADIQADVEDGQLQYFYLLAFVLQGDCWKSLTVLATRETLYLLHEDHQWRKSSPGHPDQSGGGSSGSVDVLETLPISCVSSVQLWPQDPRRMDVKLYDETVKEERTWCVRTESSELLQALQAWVRAQWEAMFGIKLHTSSSLQDAET
ncbi:serine/threonine-protein kinase 11-interacting protein isoform X2 [Nelusetta ayraudi]|uniref:serine/threonine-protein kinase 11-interacting protein isoform X2 n=1 Tax=Nelusetta ayraudi TaxID=303726 RepID=UPI003F6F17B0